MSDTTKKSDSDVREDLSAEKRQELLAQARAQAAAEVPASTSAITADMEPAPVLGGLEGGDPGAASTKPRPVTRATRVEGAIQEWGPYNDYEIVMTPWGEYAVPKGMVLYFQEAAKFSPKSGEFVLTHIPHHRMPDEPRQEFPPVQLAALTGVSG